MMNFKWNFTLYDKLVFILFIKKQYNYFFHNNYSFNLWLKHLVQCTIKYEIPLNYSHLKMNKQLYIPILLELIIMWKKNERIR